MRLILLAVFAVSVVYAGMAAEDLKPIFDGKTFDGWTKNGGAIYTIEDGVIVGKTGDRHMGWLCTTGMHANFTLQLDVKITGGNSGVQIRSHFDPEKNGDMVGYQIEVDLTPRAWSGGLYDQGRRGWLYSPTNNPAALAAFKTNDWNAYRIDCAGDRIRSWVNGVPVTDYHDAMDTNGLIALQVHSGKDAEVRFRNIRLQDH